MAEQKLDSTQIGAGLQQMNGERVAQGMSSTFRIFGVRTTVPWPEASPAAICRGSSIRPWSPSVATEFIHVPAMDRESGNLCHLANRRMEPWPLTAQNAESRAYPMSFLPWLPRIACEQP
jgi:hypothetical protein